MQNVQYIDREILMGSVLINYTTERENTDKLLTNNYC